MAVKYFDPDKYPSAEEIRTGISGPVTIMGKTFRFKRPNNAADHIRIGNRQGELRRGLPIESLDTMTHFVMGQVAHLEFGVSEPPGIDWMTADDDLRNEAFIAYREFAECFRRPSGTTDAANAGGAAPATS